MAAGKAIVATDVGGIPEELGIDTDCGILIKPNDSEVLAEALAGLIIDSDQRKIMGNNARKRAEVLFTEDRFYNNVLSNLLKDIGLE